MGTRGWGTNPDIPWCQRLSRPLQNFVTPMQRHGWKEKWIGFVEAAVSVGGLAGMTGGLYLLATSPLPGVMSTLAGMTLLLRTADKVAQVQEARCAPSRAKAARD